MMMTQDFTLIDDGQTRVVLAAVAGGRVAFAAEQVLGALGWELKPEGLCRGDVCIPVRDRERLVGPDGIDLEELARVLGRPLALEPNERMAALAQAATDRKAALTGSLAPDFPLPDLDGKLHSLSDHRGKKVLLVAYASW